MMQTTTRIRSTSLTRSMRANKWFSAITAALTLFFFLSTWYIVPSAQAADQAIKADRAKNQYHPRGRTDEEKLSNTLQDIKERVAERRAKVRKRVKEESDLWQGFLNLFGLSGLTKENLDRVDSMAEQAEQLNQKALQGFDAIERKLIDKGVPAEILQRHYDTVDKYQTEYQSFREKLRQAQTAPSLQDQDSALGDLDEFLGKQKFKRRQQPFDPNKLPFGTPDPKMTREPVTDPQELNRLLGMNTESGLIEKVADAFAKPAYADAIGGPTSADLDETIDVQITPAIEDLADQLNNNPVDIYNWVRNNIEFIPTYGSIQGSDITLQTKRGNAFDTASLLIALLRASEIPARYAMGTIRIPVEKVMNWVGGVAVPEAALSLLGQGGIPNRGITEGGLIKYVEIEHIWVEAYIDFEPSRGADNRNGDSWVPMDASFKEYDYVDPIDANSHVPFDRDSFVNTIVSGSTFNGSAGTINNVDINSLISDVESYKQQLDDFFSNQNPADVLAGALGSKTIKQEHFRMLSGNLQFKITVSPITFSEIQSNLRHKYRFQILDQFSDTILSQTFDLPSIAGKTMALAFRPKTESDESVLLSAFSQDSPDATQISIPGYLIKEEAVIQIDNEIIANGGQFQFGEEVYTESALYQPLRGWLSPSQNTIAAGEYHALGVDPGYVNRQKINNLSDLLENAQNVMQQYEATGDESLLSEDISSKRISDAIMQICVLGYFLSNDVSALYSARNLKAISYSMPSYGTFSTSLKTSYLFGYIPRSAHYTGFSMDIDNLATIAESKTYNETDRINYVKSIGFAASAFEHVLPEKLFTPIGSQNDPAQSISAVKALSIAGMEGQAIYALNSSNSNLLANITIDSDARSEIASAIYSGKEVTVHERPINAYGFSGSGYIILDPSTGAGAYKISGGANGSETSEFGHELHFVSIALKALAVIAEWMHMPGLENLLGYWLGFSIGQLGGVIDILERCLFAAETGEITMLIVIYTLMSIGIVIFLTTFFGPLGILIGYLILDAIRSFFMDMLFYLAGCREG